MLLNEESRRGKKLEIGSAQHLLLRLQMIPLRNDFSREFQDHLMQSFIKSCKQQPIA
jgi:hypothetical protein